MMFVKRLYLCRNNLFLWPIISSCKMCDTSPTRLKLGGWVWCTLCWGNWGYSGDTRQEGSWRIKDAVLSVVMSGLRSFSVIRVLSDLLLRHHGSHKHGPRCSNQLSSKKQQTLHPITIDKLKCTGSQRLTLKEVANLLNSCLCLAELVWHVYDHDQMHAGSDAFWGICVNHKQYRYGCLQRHADAISDGRLLWSSRSRSITHTMTENHLHRHT